VSAGLTSSRQSAAGSPHLSGHRLRTAGLLLLIVVALLAPIWTVRYVPLGDYPNHLASAFVLAHLNDPRFDFHSFYGADWSAYPYMMMSGILSLLQNAVSIDLAGRLLLSLCVLALPAAAWWFLREVSPGEETPALWTLITAQNAYFFLNGFINMQLGLAVCLVVLGGWVRFLKNPRAISWCFLLAAVTALYFTHLMALAIAGLALTAYSLVDRRRLRELLLGWALFVPAAGFYLHTEWPLASSWNISYRPLTGKLVGLLTAVLGFSAPLDFFTLAVGGLFWFWACCGNGDFRWRAPWAGAAGLLFALYWIFPSDYGPGLNSDFRLLPFIVVVGLAAVRLGRRLKPLAVVALLLFFIRATALEFHFIARQPHLKALANAASVIPPGSRVLPLVRSGQPIPQVERQLWAFGVIERGWFSPCLFHDSGVQPLAIKLNVYDPYAFSFCGDLKRHIDWSRVRYDYDYVWALQTPEGEPELASVASVVYTTEGLRLYRVDRIARAGPSESQRARE
jgi:hypothetical protein